MGLKEAMMKDAKSEKKKGWSWGKLGFLGSKNKAYKEAQEALDEAEGNTNTAVADAGDYEKE